MSKIYTKKGDKGTTSLYNGSKLRKSHTYFDVLGDIDELNSSLGLICVEEGHDLMEYIQCRLMDVASYIATPETSSDAKLQRVSFDFDGETKKLEDEIDKYDKLMPPLKNFIIPNSRSITSVLLHCSRTVCRRVERNVIKLSDELNSNTLDGPMKYFNRLSDYLFQLARYDNFVECGKDNVYKKAT